MRSLVVDEIARFYLYCSNELACILYLERDIYIYIYTHRYRLKLCALQALCQVCHHPQLSLIVWIPLISTVSLEQRIPLRGLFHQTIAKSSHA